ncbi:MAG: nucleotidyltransferase domain-containing protein [Acidobacteriota bacterium]
MAQAIAAEMEAGRFGVAAMYLIGSSKNARAGPASDIDLLVHFRGTPAQRTELRSWLEEWSRLLARVNLERTGCPSDGLLDVHIITDADIGARTSYAVKIAAVTDAALSLPLGRSGAAEYTHRRER